MKASRIAIAAACVMTACTQTQQPGAVVSESIHITASRDPKTITLQVSDLPDGFNEAGSVVEAHDADLEQGRSSGEVSEELYGWVKDSAFVSLAQRGFSRNDEQVNSTVVIFRTAEEAHDFFLKQSPTTALSDAPRIGDESWTEHVESGPTPVAKDEQIVDSESVRTRARVGNVVIDLVYTDDVSEIDIDEAILISKRAAGRVR